MHDSRPIMTCGVIGAGGFGREVLPLVAHSLSWHYLDSAPRIRLCFVETSPQQQTINGIPVLALDAFMALDGPKHYTIAIAESRIRQTIAEALAPSGIEPLPILAPSHQNLMANAIAPGAIFCHQTIITCNSRIGRHFHANINSYIGHDCQIGDYVTFAPGVQCNGHVHIGDHAYIGTGAILRNGTPDAPLLIGEGAVIGMGSVVTRSVAAYSTVVGNPARPLIRAGNP